MKKMKMAMSMLAGLCLFSLTGVSGMVQAEENKVKHRVSAADVNQAFTDLEKKFEARLGVYAIDTGTGRTVTHRSDERFAYASTFKTLIVGMLLKQKSVDQLNELITYTKEDVTRSGYAPITEKHIDTGMTLRELCDATLRYSDNAALNLILEEIGGPKVARQELMRIGDHTTKPSRFEPDLNEATPGDIRDTSTPKALATSLKAFTLENVLPMEKRNMLIDWMKRNTTGDKLIRAGVPDGWIVGDKTGSGGYGTRNDIAIVWPPNRAPIVIAMLSSRGEKDATYNEELIAQATKEVVHALYKK
ncbi:beta-lactamase class A [Thermoactinomyces sp. DSM 45891]|nr:beta-lactamase class A [Thermoactinomyces sp. DSM 45891]